MRPKKQQTIAAVLKILVVLLAFFVGPHLMTYAAETKPTTDMDHILKDPHQFWLDLIEKVKTESKESGRATYEIRLPEFKNTIQFMVSKLAQKNQKSLSKSDLNYIDKVTHLAQEIAKTSGPTYKELLFLAEHFVVAMNLKTAGEAKRYYETIAYDEAFQAGEWPLEGNMQKFILEAFPRILYVPTERTLFSRNYISLEAAPILALGIEPFNLKKFDYIEFYMHDVGHTTSYFTRWLKRLVPESIGKLLDINGTLSALNQISEKKWHNFFSGNNLVVKRILPKLRSLADAYLKRAIDYTFWFMLHESSKVDLVDMPAEIGEELKAAVKDTPRASVLRELNYASFKDAIIDTGDDWGDLGLGKNPEKTVINAFKWIQAQDMSRKENCNEILGSI